MAICTRSLLAICTLIPILLLFGCTSGKIDGSSPEAMAESIEHLNLSPEDGEALGQAMMAIAFSETSLAELATQSEEEIQTRLAARFDGLTPDEILGQAETLRAERSARELAQLQQDVAELEQRERAHATAAGALALFVVDSARFTLRPQRYGRDEPNIALTVTNNTPHSISRASFRGIVATPGRAVPWIDEMFSYPIPGGLEPGESATWNLAPNSFSEWGTTPVPDDAVMTAQVVDLQDASGESILGEATFGDRDRTRLAELRARLGAQSSP